MLEYNEQTENLMEIAMMLEQLKGESEYTSWCAGLHRLRDLISSAKTVLK